MRIIHYIEHNPVAAGLCSRPEEWRRSIARFRDSWQAGTVYAGQPFQPDRDGDTLSLG
jgi:hypothetical protein